MKRIAIDINSVLPLYSEGWISGIGRTTKELVEALDKMDNLPFEVVLLSGWQSLKKPWSRYTTRCISLIPMMSSTTNTTKASTLPLPNAAKAS